MRAPQDGEAGSSRASRCAVAGWAAPASATPGRGDVSHRLQWISLLFPFTVLADATNRFMWRLTAPAPQRHPRESLSFLPLSFDPSPALGWGHWSGPHTCARDGDLISPLVQRTRFVKNVNNRLLSRTGQWGRRPLLTRNASRVFRLLYLYSTHGGGGLCLFFLTEVSSSRLGGESGRGRNGERIPGVEKGSCTGNQADQSGPLE